MLQIALSNIYAIFLQNLLFCLNKFSMTCVCALQEERRDSALQSALPAQQTEGASRNCRQRGSGGQRRPGGHGVRGRTDCRRPGWRTGSSKGIFSLHD